MQRAFHSFLLICERFDSRNTLNVYQSMSHQYLWKSFKKRQVLSIKLISLGRVYLHLYICECWRKEIQERHWTKFLEILPENKERTFPQHYLFLKIDSHTLGFAYIHNDTFCQILISRFFQFCFFIFWLSSVTIFYVLRNVSQINQVMADCIQNPIKTNNDFYVLHLLIWYTKICIGL